MYVQRVEVRAFGHEGISWRSVEHPGIFVRQVYGCGMIIQLRILQTRAPLPEGCGLLSPRYKEWYIATRRRLPDPK